MWHNEERFLKKWGEIAGRFFWQCDYFLNCFIFARGSALFKMNNAGKYRLGFYLMFKARFRVLSTYDGSTIGNRFYHAAQLIDIADL